MGRSFIMHSRKKGRKEKQTSDASGIRNSSVGMDSTLHDVVYHMVTSPRNWMDFAGVSDGPLAGAITVQSNEQRGVKIALLPLIFTMSPSFHRDFTLYISLGSNELFKSSTGTSYTRKKLIIKKKLEHKNKNNCKVVSTENI